MASAKLSTGSSIIRFPTKARHPRDLDRLVPHRPVLSDLARVFTRLAELDRRAQSATVESSSSCEKSLLAVGAHLHEEGKVYLQKGCC
jgi:hypothetical protein